MAKKTRKRRARPHSTRKAKDASGHRPPSARRRGARGGRQRGRTPARRRREARTTRQGRPQEATKPATAGEAQGPGPPAAKPALDGAAGPGAEATLAQTPETGRTRRGPTNPMPTKRSTGTPSGAGTCAERARARTRAPSAPRNRRDRPEPALEPRSEPPTCRQPRAPDARSSAKRGASTPRPARC